MTDTADFPRVEPGDRTTIRIPICRGAPGWRLLESRAISPGRYVATGERSLAALGAAAILVLDGNTSAALPVVKVELTRRLGPNLEIDDAIVELLRRGVADDWNGRIVEFLGAPVEHLSMDRKAKLCRLAAATGATAALCPFDDISRRYFGQLLRARRIEAHPDRTARYAGEHFLELRGLGQRLWDLRTGSGVDATDRALQAGTALRTIVIGPDALPYELEATARVLDDTDGLAPDVTLLVLPASIELYRLAIKRNWAATIADAGGSIVDPQLVQALGLPRLLGGGESPVCVTSPIDAALIEAPLYYGSVGTLLSIAERGGA